jgi:molybdopterin-guanine dinucleotide biosynthesis protein A
VVSAIHRPAGVVLAGGASSRMGGDKASALLDGRPLLAHVLERFAPQVGALAIAGHDSADRFAAFAVPVLTDEGAARRGPLAGIVVGLRFAAREGADCLAVAPTDAPYLPRHFVARLAEARRADEIAVAATVVGAEPLFSLWPIGVVGAVEAALADGRLAVGRLIVGLPHRMVLFDEDEALCFRNLNTPADLADARRGAWTKVASD